MEEVILRKFEVGVNYEDFLLFSDYEDAERNNLNDSFSNQEVLPIDKSLFS